MELNKVSLFDFLCAVDRDTGLVLYRWPDWPGVPKFIPTDVNIIFVYHREFTTSTITEQDFQEFKVLRIKDVDGRVKLMLRSSEISAVDLGRLKLNKLKCQKIAAWLNKIHLKISASEGILPGIYGAYPGSWEEKLYQENSKKVKEIAAEVIHEFHDRLWLAVSIEELENTYNAAISRWVI